MALLQAFRSPTQRGFAIAWLAVLYGPAEGLVENLFFEAWDAGAWIAYGILYAWLAGFLYLGYRAPAYRIRLMTSGIIPLALWAIALAGTGDYTQLPPVILVVLGIMLSPKDTPRQRPRRR